MGSRIYATQFGEFLMPFHDGSGYTIVVVDIPKNRVSRALISITVDGETNDLNLPKYAPRFDSYNEALIWLEKHYEELF